MMKTNFIILALVFLLGCAGQYPPPGGPIDTTPPQIIYTSPAKNTLFFKGNEIFLEFDKYMDQRSVQEAIFVSPDLGTLEFNWSGKELKIFFEEILRENTTYILIVSTSAKDRRGNSLAETFSLPFSTGNNIDSCFITGRVYSDKPEDVKIFAYRIKHDSVNILDLSRKKPDYISQTSKDGSFSLKYLANGTYRVFAIKDVYNNLVYDPQVDQYGIPQFDILLSDSLYSFHNLKFKLTQEDTSRPFITNVQSLNKNQIKIELNEPVQPGANFKVYNPLTQAFLQVKHFELIKPNSFLLFTEDQDSVNYELHVSKILDSADNEILEDRNKVSFWGSKTNDTSIPNFEFLNIKNNEENIPLDKHFLLSFNEEILQSSFINGFILADSNGNHRQCSFYWESRVRVKILPKEILSSKKTYFIRIKLDSLIDAFNNSIKDSTFELRFRTLDKNKLSSISGRVIIDDTGMAYQNIFVEIFGLGRTRQKITSIRTNEYGKFTFNELPEGKYTIEAFIDKNANLRYDFGKIQPFEYAEPFTIYPDTINLRARWPIENVVIQF